MAIPLAFSGFAEEAPPILSGFATEPLTALDRPPKKQYHEETGYNVILVISPLLEDNRREILNLV